MKTKAQVRRQLAAIRRSRGRLKRQPGEPPFAEKWAAYKAEEHALEEAKFARQFPPPPAPPNPG